MVGFELGLKIKFHRVGGLARANGNKANLSVLECCQLFACCSQVCNCPYLPPRGGAWVSRGLNKLCQLLYVRRNTISSVTYPGDV